MPTMHGTGMHHHINERHEWKFMAYVKHLVALITGNADREKLKSMFDKFIAVVGLVGPIMTIPQIINIWGYQQVEGLALASWGTYVMSATFWLIYGVIHQEKAIICVNIAWLMAHVSVVTGIIVYS